MTKKLILSALVAVPLPYVLLALVVSISGLPSGLDAPGFMSSDAGVTFYVAAYALFFFAGIVSAAAAPSERSSTASDGGNSDSYDDSAPLGKDSGTVKWFNVNKGFGFITTDDGEDIFVHFRSIKGKGRRSLRQGQSVRFDIAEGEKGLQAENVSVVR